MPEARALLGGLDRGTGPAFRRLNAAVAGLVDEWSLVSFAPLDYSDEESVGDVLAQARAPRLDCAHPDPVCLPAMPAAPTVSTPDERVRCAAPRGHMRSAQRPVFGGACRHMRSTHASRLTSCERPRAQVDHAIQFGEDADVKIRDLGMGELGGEDM